MYKLEVEIYHLIQIVVFNLKLALRLEGRSETHFCELEDFYINRFPSYNMRVRTQRGEIPKMHAVVEQRNEIIMLMQLQTNI